MERITERGYNFETTKMSDGLHDCMGTALNKLTAYEDAEEQGRLVVLPCKVGDTVWLLIRGGIESWKIYAIKQRESGGWEMYLRNGMLSQKRPNEFEVCTRRFSSVGKTVFITREEAEKALEGMK